MEFPKKITGGIDLRSLEFANNIIFPQKLKGDLNLQSLVKAVEITFPSEITSGEVVFNNL